MAATAHLACRCRALAALAAAALAAATLAAAALAAAAVQARLPDLLLRPGGHDGKLVAEIGLLRAGAARRPANRGLGLDERLFRPPGVACQSTAPGPPHAARAAEASVACRSDRVPSLTVYDPTESMSAQLPSQPPVVYLQ